MAADESTDFVARFNREGGPVPETDADHLKKMWVRTREAELMGHATKVFGLGAVGIDASEFGAAPGEKMTALVIRLDLLRSLFERNVLREYLRGEDFAAQVFQAAASLPGDRDDMGEAMIQLAMKQHPEADCSEVKREMVAHGLRSRQAEDRFRVSFVDPKSFDCLGVRIQPKSKANTRHRLHGRCTTESLLPSNCGSVFICAVSV